MSLDQDRSGVVRLGVRRTADLPRRRGESLAVLATFTVLYTAVGLWLVRDLHVVEPETLDRWARALAIWHGDDPGLGAVGRDHAPLSVLLLAPFTLVSSLATSQVAIPVVSALGAGWVMVVLDTMMRRATLDLPVRLAVLAALGLNPVVVVHAATGGHDVLWLALVVTALGGLVAWYVTADVRFVMVSGFAFAGATLTGYGSLPFVVVSTVAVAALVRRLGADRTEVEGTTVGFASPALYVVVLWAGFNAVALGRPFGWLVPDRGPAVSFADAARGTADLVLHGAPVALVVLPALVVAGTVRRNPLALWLGLLLLTSILLPGIGAVLGLADRPPSVADALPVLLLAVVGGIWLARSALTDARLVAGALVTGLLLSVPVTFAAMGDASRPGLERSFHDAVVDGAAS